MTASVGAAGVGAAQSTPDHAAPSERELQRLRAEIALLDSQIVDIVRRRTELERRTRLVRVRAGAPRVVHTGEIDVIRYFHEQLGREGSTLAMVLLRLGSSDADPRAPRGEAPA